MKNIHSLVLFSAISLLLASCAKPGYEITGTIKGEASKVYLQRFDNKMYPVVDSCLVADGKFQFKGAVGMPELHRIVAEPGKQFIEIFLENSKITAHLDTQDRDSCKVIGSSADSVYKAYMQTYLKGNEDIISDIKHNPKSSALAYCVYRYHTYNKTADELHHTMYLFDTSVVNRSVYMQQLNTLIQTYRRLEPGNPTIEVALPDTSGVEQKLSAFEGNYVLLDFWASWCGPCRQENPHFVKIYQKYHPKGFQIYAVSLDKDGAAWKKAIKDDQLTWTHVSELTMWQSKAAEAYGVRAIPSNFLIDPRGRILARNIMGEDLDKKLEELYAAIDAENKANKIGKKK